MAGAGNKKACKPEPPIGRDSRGRFCRVRNPSKQSSCSSGKCSKGSQKKASSGQQRKNVQGMHVPPGGKRAKLPTK